MDAPGGGTSPARWKHAVLLLALASVVPIYLLVSLPPLWIQVDSVVLTTWDVTNGVLPHYPPLYPFFTRSINFLTMWAFYGGTGDAVGKLAYNFSDVGIYTILGIQHALGVIALVVLAMTAAESLPKRIVVLVLLLLNPTYFLSTHTLATEALWLPILALTFACSLSIWRSDKALSRFLLSGYFVLLCLNFLTRHTGVIVAALLPGLLGMRALCARNRSQTMRWLGITALTFLSFFAADQTARQVCRWYGIEPRSIWGRAAIYRLAVLDWQAIGLEEKARLMAEMQEKTDDPFVRKAIPRAFVAKHLWFDLWNEIRQMVEMENPGMPYLSQGRQADAILNEICRLFFTSAGGYLWTSVQQDFLTYVRLNAATEYPYYLLMATAQTYPMFLDNHDLRNAYRHVSVCDPARLSETISCLHDFYETSPYIRNTKWYGHDVLLLVLSSCALLAWVFRRVAARDVFFVLFSLASVLGYFLVISAVTIYAPRYGIYAANVLAICGGILIGAFRVSRAPCPSPPPDRPTIESL